MFSVTNTRIINVKRMICGCFYVKFSAMNRPSGPFVGLNVCFGAIN